MQPEMEKKKALDLNIALNNLGCAARAAFLNFDQHKIVEESFERIAEFMGYVPPVIKK